MSVIQEMHLQVKQMIEAHDHRDYHHIKSLLSKAAVEGEHRWFTKEKFEKICKALNDDMGGCDVIEHVADVKRKSSVFTLWTAKYVNFDDVVLWQFVFDDEGKVRAMAVDWGEYSAA